MNPLNSPSCANSFWSARMPAEGLTAEALANHVQRIPTLPTVLIELSKRMEDPKTSSDDLAQVIQQDQAISSKVLKLVNSPFYGYSGKIRSEEHTSELQSRQ